MWRFRYPLEDIGVFYTPPKTNIIQTFEMEVERPSQNCIHVSE